MNSLISAIGSSQLSFIVSTAQVMGLSHIAPSSITYYRGATVAYDPDSGETKTWDQVATISDVLVGHYKESDIAFSNGQIERGDIMAMFLQSELSASPGPGDVITFDGSDYDYADHRAAAGLYLVRVRRPSNG